MSGFSQVTVPPISIATVLGRKHSFVSSHPGVEEPDALTTIELARKLKCDDLNAFTFAPYHGTSLRLLCEDKNYINPDTLVHIYIHDSMLTMPTLSKPEMRGLMKTFVFYARLPRSYWKEIKLAELETKEGLAKYDELLTLYRENSFNQAVES